MYPSESKDTYILSRVLVETGGNADSWPTEERTITPYVADAAPEGFADAGVVVKAVSATRTFWEKLTILHKTAHRFDGVPGWHPAARYSRHYYDVYRLTRSIFAQSAIADVDLAEAVRDAAITFFPDNKASYDKFIPGSIRLVPADAAIPALAEDYRAMRDMIFGEYPSFDEIMTELRSLEERLNGHAQAFGLKLPIGASPTHRQIGRGRTSQFITATGLYRKLWTTPLQTSDHPSTITKRSSLQGIEMTGGESITMPSPIRIAATAKSIATNGR